MQITLTAEKAARYTAEGWWTDRIISDDLDAVAAAHPDRVQVVGDE